MSIIDRIANDVSELRRKFSQRANLLLLGRCEYREALAIMHPHGITYTRTRLAPGVWPSPDDELPPELVEIGEEIYGLIIVRVEKESYFKVAYA